jgi:hypothetical protein
MEPHQGSHARQVSTQTPGRSLSHFGQFGVGGFVQRTELIVLRLQAKPQVEKIICQRTQNVMHVAQLIK